MDYKQSLNLPRTDFPMKANLSQKEPEMLRRWDEMGIYGRIREAARGRQTYILHDGPPYANGNIHLGTALNKIIKDMVIKAKNMSGLDSVYVPGWDCHGLPIEHQVDKELGGKPVPHHGLRLRGHDRGGIRQAVVQRERLQGEKARLLVRHLQDGLGRGRGGVP